MIFVALFGAASFGACVGFVAAALLSASKDEESWK